MLAWVLVRGATCSALLVLLCAQLSAAAEPGRALVNVRRALASLKYAEAFALASEALAHGGASAEEVVALYRAQGEAAAVLGDAPAAERAFASMLELSPGEQLAADSSPKLLHPLARARARLHGAHLTLETRSAMLLEGWVRTEVTVNGDVLGLVNDVQLVPLAGGAQTPLNAAGRELSWQCTAAPCPHQLRVRDAAGNVLAELGTAAAPRTVRPLPPPPAPQPAPKPLWARPLPYALGGAALALTGGIFAWQLHEAEGQLRDIQGARGDHTLAEAQAADRRRHTDSLAMAASFAGAAVLGGVAVAVW